MSGGQVLVNRQEEDGSGQMLGNGMPGTDAVGQKRPRVGIYAVGIHKATDEVAIRDDEGERHGADTRR